MGLNTLSVSEWWRVASRACGLWEVFCVCSCMCSHLWAYIDLKWPSPTLQTIKFQIVWVRAQRDTRGGRRVWSFSSGIKLALLVVCSMFVVVRLLSSPPVCLSVFYKLGCIFFFLSPPSYMDALTHPPTHGMRCLTHLCSLPHTLTHRVLSRRGLACYSNSFGKARLYMSVMNRAVATRVMKCVHCFTSWKKRKEMKRMRGSLGRWGGQEQRSARSMVHEPTSRYYWHATKDLKLSIY